MSKAIVFVLLANFFTCFFLPADAASFNVGGSGGWTFGVSSWPNGKSFKAGDILVFKYPQGAHTVVVVNEANFNSCTPVGTMLTSGNDRITLAKGKSFYICGIPGHCPNLGMKIAITAN